ncbi:discoidin domain-containing protein [Sanguibacter sp. 25GB23B1]|uniref:discoidin domain-containing protein n=1 Tax=unclassified Sanguibacter TaxID=2645534 RepID=UPI0032AFAB84
MLTGEVTTALDPGPVVAAEAAATLLSQGKPVTASSSEGAGIAAALAVDGDGGTRWSSGFTDTEWIQVDLGSSVDISQVVLDWENAYGKAFTLQTSDDGTTWRTLHSVTNGTGGVQTLDVEGNGRYVRMQGVERATGYGYSLWELKVFGGAVTPPPGGGGECGTTNAALGTTATASSAENGGTPASAAVDGDAGTRWASSASDQQWLQVDLGSSQDICGVVLRWEAAYGKAFDIQTSEDGATWTTIHTVTDGTGGVQTLDVEGTGRYLRMSGAARATGYGYSLWELEVHTTTTTDGPVLPGGGDLGENVYVFDPTMPTSEIQATLDTAFTAQESDQFGPGRYQFLFKPGSYDVHANIGFYTSINGLGQNPDDVNINGGVWVDAQWFDGNATQNFWRSAENLSITPHTGEARWAVSQAAPFRRIHVKGDLSLAPSSYGWSSGGFIADTKVDGTVRSYSQQQWLSRDSEFGAWEGSVWNMLFSGVEGSPPPSFPNPSHTVLDTSPLVREKPYLYAEGDDYAVFVPELATATRGTTWADGETPGTSIPLDEFFVADPADSAATINQALDQGLHLLFTPGVYHVDQTITVDRPDTVVLGLGYATIINDDGVVPMKVADVDGVKIAGLLFDAGTTNAPVLLQVGEPGSSASHEDNPISVHDVFLRVGGAVGGKVTTAMEVNSDDTIIDHIWSWRGDHGQGIGWDVNTSANGFVVNGDDVLAYGLFVEHYQEHNTVWNGERGRTIFYQSELAYDPPNQAAWMNGDTLGWASYKVGDDVTKHEAWGIGAYSFNNVDPTIVTESGIEAPVAPGVRFHNMLTVSLGGNGIINHVINDTGDVAQGTDTIPSYLVSNP